MKEKFVDYGKDLQCEICGKLEAVDGTGKFREDIWSRVGGGGGRSRILEEGSVFEKAGVNISEVGGEVNAALARQLNTGATHFFAAGISLVIHPLNPWVPTTHANFRYFELYDARKNKIDSWFGGGADLTPYYLHDEDVIHFHRTWRDVCDAFDPLFYPRFKKQCDDYFNNAHRGNERRGVGGIFYDYLRPTVTQDDAFLLNLSKSCGDAFMQAYLPIVERTKDIPFTEKNVCWQHQRRGRYVEFNLLHDRGTLFGLKSNGRTESILMSLRPRVRFDYCDEPREGSEEARLVDVLKNPVNWC